MWWIQSCTNMSAASRLPKSTSLFPAAICRPSIFRVWPMYLIRRYFYVGGNHDIRYKDKLPQGGLDLHGRLERFKGFNFFGLAGSRWYNGGPFQYTEGQMRAKIRRLRPTLWWQGGIDIVVTHAPPRHVHDSEDLCHRGFRSFRWLIDKYQPDYFIHGHIHRHFTDPSERITVVDATKVVNTYGYNILEIEIRPKVESKP